MNNGLTHTPSAVVLLQRAQHDVERQHAVLVDDLRELAKRFLELADRLEAEGVTAEVNPDGIVQGRGAAIDVACARFMCARRHLGLLQRTANA